MYRTRGKTNQYLSSYFPFFRADVFGFPFARPDRAGRRYQVPEDVLPRPSPAVLPFSKQDSQLLLTFTESPFPFKVSRIWTGEALWLEFQYSDGRLRVFGGSMSGDGTMAGNIMDNRTFLRRMNESGVIIERVKVLGSGESSVVIEIGHSSLAEVEVNEL